MTSQQNFRAESFVTGLAIKAPCVVNSIADLTLSGEQTVNSVAVVAGDRVLVMAQTAPAENGIYNVEVSAWQRSGDFDGNRDVTTRTLVAAGNSSGVSILYEVTTALPISIGTTSIAFAILPATSVALAGGSVALPSLSFGDGDSGVVELVDDVLSVTLSATKRWQFSGTAFEGHVVGAAIINGTPSGTAPRLCPGFS